MSLFPHFPDGYYDDNGLWQRTKFCLVSCGERCTCMPPNALWQLPTKQSELPVSTMGRFQCRECTCWYPGAGPVCEQCRTASEVRT